MRPLRFSGTSSREGRWERISTTSSTRPGGRLRGSAMARATEAASAITLRERPCRREGERLTQRRRTDSAASFAFVWEGVEMREREMFEMYVRAVSERGGGC
jgi:hypothetical protein